MPLWVPHSVATDRVAIPRTCALPAPERPLLARSSMRIYPLLPFALLSACTVGDQTPWGGQELQTVDDPVVGVSLRVPVDWAVEPDPALFETHGFLLHTPTAEAVARVALAYDATDVEAMVAAKLEQYADVSPQRSEVTLADGVVGVAITGLPGTEPYSVVFVGDGTRVYEIGLWSEAAGLDERGHDLLGELRFRAPTETIESRHLGRADDALFAEPSTTSLAASEQRRAAFERAAAADPGNASYWTNLGNARRALGDTRAAERAYARALEQAPAYADGLNGLGALMVQSGRAPQAVLLFERAIASEPAHLEARLNLAIAYQESGRLDEARRGYREVVARARAGSREHTAATALLAGLK